jgi:hypothetical protein
MRLSTSDLELIEEALLALAEQLLGKPVSDDLEAERKISWQINSARRLHERVARERKGRAAVAAKAKAV